MPAGGRCLRWTADEPVATRWIGVARRSVARRTDLVGKRDARPAHVSRGRWLVDVVGAAAKDAVTVNARVPVVRPSFAAGQTAPQRCPRRSSVPEITPVVGIDAVGPAGRPLAQRSSVGTKVRRRNDRAVGKGFAAPAHSRAVEIAVAGDGPSAGRSDRHRRSVPVPVPPVVGGRQTCIVNVNPPAVGVPAEDAAGVETVHAQARGQAVRSVEIAVAALVAAR